MARSRKDQIVRCACRILPGYIAMVALYLLYRFGLYPLFGKDWSYPLRRTMELCAAYGVGLGILYLRVRRIPADLSGGKDGGCVRKDPRARIKAWACLLVIQSGLSVPVLVLAEVVRTAIFHMDGTLSRPNVTFIFFYILYFLILRPVLEEFVYRAVLLRRLKEMGAFTSSLYVAFLSAVMTYFMDGLPQACAMILLSFLWSELYQKMAGRKNRLTVTIILHSFSNLWTVLLPWFLKSSRPGLVVYTVVWIVIVPMIAIDRLIRLNHK